VVLTARPGALTYRPAHSAKAHRHVRHDGMKTEMDSHIEFWTAVHAIVSDAAKTLPRGDDPRAVHWDHPDEQWKNDAELAHIEDEHLADVHELVAHYCEKHAWPTRSKSAARFILARRLTWARKYAYVLTTPSTRLLGAAIHRPPHSGWDVIHWLLIDAYDNRSEPQPEMPMVFFPQKRSGSAEQGA
jgi:hypothetical protein